MKIINVPMTFVKLKLLMGLKVAKYFFLHDRRLSGPRLAASDLLWFRDYEGNADLTILFFGL